MFNEDRYFVVDLKYDKHIKPVLNILKTWKRIQIQNILKYEDYADKLKWFGIYKGHSINDIVALASVEIRKRDKEIYLNVINSNEKGTGKYLINKIIYYFKKNKNGCDHISWISDPDSGEQLRNYYRNNFPDAREIEEKNEYWKTSKFIKNL